MKKIAVLIALIAAGLAAQTTFNFGQFGVLNSSIATPVQLTNGNTIKAKSLTIFGKKGYQVDNATVVYVGFTSVNGEQCIPIQPGASITLTDGFRQGFINASNVWLDVTTINDGAIIIYE